MNYAKIKKRNEQIYIETGAQSRPYRKGLREKGRLEKGGREPSLGHGEQTRRRRQESRRFGAKEIELNQGENQYGTRRKIGWRGCHYLAIGRRCADVYCRVSTPKGLLRVGSQVISDDHLSPIRTLFR